MSEKLTPRQAGEMSADYLRDHSKRIGNVLLKTMQMKEDNRSYDHAKATLDNVDEYYAHMTGPESDFDKEELPKEQFTKNVEENLPKAAMKATEAAHKVAIAEHNAGVISDRAGRHYKQNEAAYFDAAHAEAMIDGVHINVEQQDEAAQTVEVRVPES